MSDHILDTINLVQLGNQLQQARKRQGLTQEAAAKLIEVARTTLTAIENGERRIKASELMKLAAAYGRDAGDFLRAQPQLPDLQVQFRSSMTRTVEDDARITAAIALLQELCLAYLELEELMQTPLHYYYPPIYRYEGRRTEPAAEGLAIAERNRLGLGEAPIPALRELLEKQVGLRIFYIPLQPSAKFSEIYFFDPLVGGCIAINQLHSNIKERCRWSLAHAYAHFLAHRSKPTISIADEYQRKPESERFADAFAGYFLLPTNSITQRFNALYQAQEGKVTPADLVKLAHYYGVSFEALTRRLEEMRLIPSGVGDRLQARGFKVKEAQEQLGLKAIAEPTDQLPLRYIKLAVEAYQQGEVSEGELARYLRTDLLTAREMAVEYQEKLFADPTIDQDLRDLVAA